MLKLINRLYLWAKTRSSIPWASFEVGEIGEDGQMKVHFNWNEPFIKKLHQLGFKAETDEDTVQLFFYASQMQPGALDEDEKPVVSEMHPTLSNQQNTFKT